MPILTVLSLTPITEHYREAVIEDKFYRRINVAVSNAQETFPSEPTNEAIIAAAIAHGSIPNDRSEYRVTVKAFDEGLQLWVGAVEAFDRETEETVQTPTVKAPLQALPENFDSLPQAQQHAALIHYGQHVARTVNFDDY